MDSMPSAVITEHRLRIFLESTLQIHNEHSGTVASDMWKYIQVEVDRHIGPLKYKRELESQVKHERAHRVARWELFLVSWIATLVESEKTKDVTGQD